MSGILLLGYLGALVVPSIPAVKGIGYRGVYMAGTILAFLFAFFVSALISTPVPPEVTDAHRVQALYDEYGTAVVAWFVFAAIGTLLAGCVYRKPQR